MPVPSADLGEFMRHRILHLSDTHLTATGFDEDGVNAAASLKRILFDARYLEGLDLVLVSGDLADDGSAAGYEAVQEIVGGFAADRGIPHVYAVGNHDDRAAFTQVLGSGHLSASGTDTGRPWPGGPERAAVSDLAGLRIITIDSLIPGFVHGLISSAQLQWLAGVLAQPAPAVHHPPVHVPSSVFVATGGLQNTDELAGVVAGSDVRAILCGHYHVQLAGQLAGIPVWVTPGVVTRVDLTAPPGLVRAVQGASATVVDLDGPFSPSFYVIHARDPEAGRQVYLADAISWAAVDAEDEEAQHSR
jgi:3',5'-cyclic-AMP phosphodiesterase